MQLQPLPGEIQSCLQVVAAAHDADAIAWSEGAIAVQRVSGGFNNALYRVHSAGCNWAVKLCVADERQRAAREYSVMGLLRAAGLDIAPEPLHLDESCAIVAFPVVVYRWLPGTQLGPMLNALQLAAVRDTFQCLHGLEPGDGSDAVPDAWFHWFDSGPYLEELGYFLSKYGAWLASTGPRGLDLRDRLARLVDGCREAFLVTAADLRREAVTLRLCRVDANLANAIWGQDGQLRWVDWEFSGWGDPALDLAELRWHAALSELSPAQHAWLRDSYRRPAGDPAFEERVALWDRLVATRWPFLILRWLWSLHHGPDRVRLTEPMADPAELRSRLALYVERAEQLVGARSVFK